VMVVKMRLRCWNGKTSAYNFIARHSFSTHSIPKLYLL
jgi:hypothetical protein